MDSRSWMYGRQDTDEYMTGFNEFLECARENQMVTGERHLPCPCWKCQNVLRQLTIKVLKDHLIYDRKTVAKPFLKKKIKKK
jgi:Transposase-associated domain